MLANNPHLQKKRSSKKGLGRSLMRRITEIPETMGRQYMRDDKELGEHASNRNSMCVLRKNTFEAPHSAKPIKEESLKNKVFSLKKSHSSYDHVRDQGEDLINSADNMEVATTERSVLESLEEKLVKKDSPEKIDAANESTESVPLVCKSASAHNLTADKKPLHPRTSMLQKSLSVIASAKERTLSLGKTQCVEDPNKKPQQKNKDEKSPVENEGKEGYMKMIVSQSVEYKQSTTKTGIMKRQNSGSQPSISSETAKCKDGFNISEVCPWELEDLPTPSENKVQKHVSISAERPTTIHSNNTKAGKQQQQKHKGLDQSPTSTRRPFQKSVDKVEGKSKESPNQTDGFKPISNSNNAPAREKASQGAEVCPWDFEELPLKLKDSDQSRFLATEVKDNTDENNRESTYSKSKSKELLPSKSSGSSHKVISKANICPWDHEPTSSSSEKMPSPSQVIKMKNAPTTTMETNPGKIFPKEIEKTKTTDDVITKIKCRDKSTLGKTTERPIGQAHLADICPWDVDSSQEIGMVEKQNDPNTAIVKSKQAEICPWDYEEPATKESTTITGSSIPKQKSPNSSRAIPSSAKKADVCPWDFDDQTSTKKA